MPARNTRGSWALSVPVTVLTTITGEPIPAPGAASASSMQRKKAAIVAAAARRPAGRRLPNLAIGNSEQAPATQPNRNAISRLRQKRFGADRTDRRAERPGSLGWQADAR